MISGERHLKQRRVAISYYELSEQLGVSRNDTADALSLLRRVRDDLDPSSFTTREIVDEGIDGRTSLKRDYKSMTDKSRMARVRRLLRHLAQKGLVEKDGSTYSLIQTDIEFKYLEE